MHLRKALVLDLWVQLLLALGVLVLLNVLASRHFGRLDLTEERIYTLSDASRAIAGHVERPLVAKVYFTKNLDPPYNNHEQIVVDKLEEFQAYSHGRMEIQVTDPTRIKEKQEEARQYGIEPIQYNYRDKDRSEVKQVYMGVALIYGDRQASLEAITQVATIEYDIARLVRRLTDSKDTPTVGITSGASEVDLFKEGGPEEKLATELGRGYQMVKVPLGGEEGVPESVSALLMLGPQQQVSDRTRYQLDQFLMRGGSLAVFVSNVLPDAKRLVPIGVYHGMELFLAGYGVQVNRDLVVDRKHNGRMSFPVIQGRRATQALVNTPLIPMIRDFSPDSQILKGLDQMLFPFTSSITLADPLPSGVEGKVLARASADAGRIKSVRTIVPSAYEVLAPGEETGAWPVMVALSGTFESAYRDRAIPAPRTDALAGASATDDPSSKITVSAPARLVVAASHQVPLNNISFMLNLVDWMCEDVDLIGIRSKAIQLPTITPPEPSTLRWIKLVNAGSASFLLVCLGLLRWWLRRRASTRMEVL